MWICQLVRKHGAVAETIDYFRQWEEQELVDSIIKFFGKDPEIYLGTSGSVDDGNTTYFKQICEQVRERLPHLKVILGGYRVATGDASWVDASFIGRCSNLVEDYFCGKDISVSKISNDPPTYKNPYNIILEEPIAPLVSEHDFIDSRELLTIELGLGCKFNCAFCGFDYRNNRRPVINTVQNVYDACQSAYDMYGVTNFYLADDTINEVDDKLELLGEVCKKLSYKPNFMAFARLDIIGAKKHQVDLLREANINTLFFGIESLNPTVTKSIRKGGNPERNYDALRYIKQEYSDAFTYGNFIAGLAGDSEEGIHDSVDKIIDEQLLTSAGINPLRIYSRIDNPDSQSEIDKNPAKYGYTILEGGKFAGQYGYDADNWSNDWCDNNKAEEISIAVEQKFASGLESIYTAHEFAGIKSLLPGYGVSDYNKLIYLANRTQEHMIVKKYIRDKKNTLRSLTISLS